MLLLFLDSASAGAVGWQSHVWLLQFKSEGLGPSYCGSSTTLVGGEPDVFFAVDSMKWRPAQPAAGFCWRFLAQLSSVLHSFASETFGCLLQGSLSPASMPAPAVGYGTQYTHVSRVAAVACQFGSCRLLPPAAMPPGASGVGWCYPPPLQCIPRRILGASCKGVCPLLVCLPQPSWLACLIGGRLCGCTPSCTVVHFRVPNQRGNILPS
jgi:hypothetical protein